MCLFYMLSIEKNLNKNVKILKILQLYFVFTCIPSANLTATKLKDKVTER